MSSNVGLTTPRGSGTSGYVQRNTAFMKPRNAGYGAPYPPIGGPGADRDRAFKQRMPDKKILEHDRLRIVEVKVMEERERLEEENDRIEELQKSQKKKKGKASEEKEEGEQDDEERILSEEEIDEACEVLRAKLLKEMEEGGGGAGGRGSGAGGKAAPKDRRTLKAYQVHELAEAKIEESERLRRALGLKEDKETGEISGGFRERRERRDRD